MGTLRTPAGMLAADANAAADITQGRHLHPVPPPVDDGAHEHHRPDHRIPHLRLVHDSQTTLSTPDDVHGTRPSIDVIETGTPSRWSAFTKRSIDLVGGLLLLVVALPMLLLIAAWISVDSHGSPIFTQRRVGQGRRTFTIYKFRTMVPDAEAMIRTDPIAWAQYAQNWKIANDPRVTRCGAILRKWSLDELPQILNVIKGDMSLVGPRPYLPHELSGEFGIHAARITSVRPGMTGLWQVSGRSNLTPHSRIQLDERYVRDCSVALDLKILLRTVKVVILRNGAH